MNEIKIGDRGSTIRTHFINNYLRNEKLPLIIVCPGGGYSHLSPREGTPVSLEFNTMGYHSVVFEYCHGYKNPMPYPVIDLAKAVLHFRNNANEYNIDPEHIYLCGFSAGGHLISSLGILWNDLEFSTSIGTVPEKIKPNGLILGYPVIDLNLCNSKVNISKEEANSMLKNPNLPNDEQITYSNKKIFFNPQINMNALICGQLMDQELMEKYSISNKITKSMPMSFIWHGAQDSSIYIQNSINYMNAMNKNGASCELHIFSSGVHGCSLGTRVTAAESEHINIACEQWICLVKNWLKRTVGRYDEKY